MTHTPRQTSATGPQTDGQLMSGEFLPWDFCVDTIPAHKIPAEGLPPRTKFRTEESA